MILAKGKIAKKPYELSYLGQNIYSIEELCYVIYHNIYGINEEFFQISLAKWMKEELGVKELAEKLEAMIVGEHGLKDLVVTTLCGCDYYNEEEIRGIVKVLDEIDHLPSYQKKKIKADNYVRTGHYGKAVMAYRKLLQGRMRFRLHRKSMEIFYIMRELLIFTRLRFWRRGRISAKPISGTIKENRCSIICGFC